MDAQCHVMTGCFHPADVPAPWRQAGGGRGGRSGQKGGGLEKMDEEEMEREGVRLERGRIREVEIRSGIERVGGERGILIG